VSIIRLKLRQILYLVLPSYYFNLVDQIATEVAIAAMLAIGGAVVLYFALREP